MFENNPDHSISIFIEYELNNSAFGLKFEQYFDYPGNILKEYCYTESFVFF